MTETTSEYKEAYRVHYLDLLSDDLGRSKTDAGL